MSKKLFAGMLLGGAATYAAWQKMAPAKKEAVKQKFNDTLNDVADYVTDYTLDALDIVDSMMSETNFNDKVTDAAGAVNTVTEKVKDSASKVVNKMTNDDFDKQTADIREELAKSQENQEKPTDDIVIDATSEKESEDENKDESEK